MKKLHLSFRFIKTVLFMFICPILLLSCGSKDDSSDDYVAPQPTPTKPQDPAPANGGDTTNPTNGGDNANPVTPVTPAETNTTNTENGIEVDSVTGTKYYITLTTNEVKNSKISENNATLPSSGNPGATIKTDGTIALNTDADVMKNAVSANITTSLYKDETTVTKKYYTDENRSIPASEKQDDVTKTTTYHAEVVVSGQDLKIMIKSQNYPTTKTVDVKQYFDAKTQLDAVVNMATVNFDENSDDAFKKRAVDLVKEYAESEGITDLANDKITFTGITSVTPRYGYDYESDLAGTTFNVKMSDVETINTSDASKDLISNVSSYVYQNINSTYLRAIKFSDDVKKLNVDLGSTETDLTYKYQGGVIAKNATVSFSNANNAKLSGSMYSEQLKNNTLFSGLSKDENLPELSIKLMNINGDTGNDDDANLYGTGIDKIVDNYHNHNKLSSVNITKSIYTAFNFNAKKFLEDKGEDMFSETGYNDNSAYELSANAAALMMNAGVNVSNVAITGTNSTGKTSLGGTRTNIYTTTDWSSITNSGGEDRGIIYFANKTPSYNRIGGSNAKVILGTKEAYNANAKYHPHTLDISALDKIVQDSIDIGSINGTIYFSSDVNRAIPGTTNAYIFGSTYRGTLDYTYTNAAWEKYGNTKNDADLKAGKVDASKYRKISLLNDIELSPAEKLLFNNQRTYG